MIKPDNYEKIFPGEGLVNHQEFEKQANTGGIYSPFVLALQINDLDWMGSYNYSPTGFTEISTEEFSQKQFEGFPVLHTQRQLIYNNDGSPLQKMIVADMTFFSGCCGYAIERSYYEKTIKYYVFEKCSHSWLHTKNIGKCFNEYTCQKCKSVKQVDSSD